ncbi:DUF4118 domain-containing protein [Thioflavicoccus mobilis]|uniref:DUF4118 domain-containing protein n=1 Tax=Thioflavicoccus mobilis TaxID=80679 RepID=UPI0003023B7E|nr:DUF4118 domain-containing protein [Thioflavicoccus mobilis]
MTFFPTVAIAAVIGGLWPGLYTAVLGVVLATYLFWPPYGEIAFSSHRETLLSNVVFLIDALLVCSAIEAMHRFYRKFADAEGELRLAASVFDNSAEGIILETAVDRFAINSSS